MSLCSISPHKQGFHDSTPAFSTPTTCLFFFAALITVSHYTIYIYLFVYISSPLNKRKDFILSIAILQHRLDNIWFLKKWKQQICTDNHLESSIIFIQNQNKPTSNKPYWTEFKIQNLLKADLRKGQKKESLSKFDDSSKIIQTFWFLPIQSHKETFSTLM